MRYGPIPSRKLPKQDSRLIMLNAERFMRASQAQRKWAELARKCVDYFEGRQWTAEQIASMTRQNRPALTFNIIAPLARLIVGYQRNNKSDIVYRPGSDARSSEQTADVLTALEKQLADMNDQDFVDTEVFLDGILTGRGFFRTTLDFTDNDLGEVHTRAVDPFRIYPDPDGDSYDLNEGCAYVQSDRYVSIDWLEDQYGKATADLVRPFVHGQTPAAMITSHWIDDQITPVRNFGATEDNSTEWFDQFYATMGDFVDTARKTIRIVETEYKVREPRNVIIDLETGDKKILPENWNREKIEKVLAYADYVGNPCVVEKRIVERLHWHTMCGDLVLHHTPSPYQSFSVNGFFPYFRRGITRGAVADLLDPQDEKNKRRSVEIEMVSKLSNGGWQYHEKSLTPQQKLKLKTFGSTPGYMMEWTGEQHMRPTQIAPAAPPMAHERLEQKSDEDVRRISGINEAALGEMDRVQSGRALEARQRQAVISIQMYMDNFSRAKKLLGKKRLEIIQNHYTEERMYRVLGEDSKMSILMLNQTQTDPATGVKRVLNDVTVGKYIATVDETPLSATFANAQFEEMLVLLEKMGPSLGPFMPLFGDLMIEMSSMPRKQEWIERLQQIAQAQGAGPQPGQPQPGAPPGPMPGNAPSLDQAVTPGGVQQVA